MDPLSIPQTLRSADEDRIGFLGVFASSALESAFQQQQFRDNLWLSRFLVAAGIIRVSLLLVADYSQFGVNQAFWLLVTSRLVFLLVSAWVLYALPRAGSPAAAERLLFAWGFLLIAMTVYALSTRPPSSTGLLLMSFGMTLLTYCVTPLSVSRQATLALTYSIVALCVCRQTDGVTLWAVGAAHGMSHIFGAVMSWRLNHRRRKMFLGSLREAELRTKLEAAIAEVKTLRGMLCMCAWCKRIRDEAEDWKAVEEYVQRRTHASFSHGICPDCLQSQLVEFASSRL